MKSREKGELFIPSSLGDLTGCLCIVTIIVFMFAPRLYGSREMAETGVVKVVRSERPTISRIDMIEMAAERQPGTEPALAMMLYEPA